LELEVPPRGRIPGFLKWLVFPVHFAQRQWRYAVGLRKASVHTFGQEIASTLSGAEDICDEKAIICPVEGD
jgi:hypothetical protein